MPLHLILIILALVTESFITTWHSSAIHTKLNEKAPFKLPVALAITRSAVFALGILSGGLGSFALPGFYIQMAYALIFIIGLKMITENYRFSPEERIVLVDSNKTLLLVSVAGSFNTFFIGMSLGLIGTRLLIPTLFTFVVTLVLSFVSLYYGTKRGLHPFIRMAGIVAGSLIAIIAISFFIKYFLK